MKALVSYLAIFAAGVFGIFQVISVDVVTPETRIIAVHVSREKQYVTKPFLEEGGSIDSLKNEGSGIHLVGWVAPFIDEIIVVPKIPTPEITLRVGLSQRRDVVTYLEDERYLWSGVDLFVANSTAETVKCVVLNGPSGAKVAWTDGSPCEWKPTKRGFDLSDIQDSPPASIR